MNILLNGYFDRNFGDDLMQQMAVSVLKEHTIYIFGAPREMLAHLYGFSHVKITDRLPEIDVKLNVIGSGFMYNGKRSKAEKLFSMMHRHPRETARRIVLDCSIEPFDSSLSERLTRHDFGQYERIICRDDQTFRYLKERFKKKEIFYYPDMIFASPMPDLLPRENLLGISAVGRWYRSGNDSYNRKIAEFSDLYIEKTGNRVAFFAFDMGMENDASAAIAIRQQMKHKDRTELVLYESDPMAFLQQISRCSEFIGTRFHSAVAAMKCGLSPVTLQDTAKLKNLTETCQLRGLDKATFTPQQLLNMLSQPHSVDCEKWSISAAGHLTQLVEFLKK